MLRGCWKWSMVIAVKRAPGSGGAAGGAPAARRCRAGRRRRWLGIHRRGRWRGCAVGRAARGAAAGETARGGRAAAEAAVAGVLVAAHTQEVAPERLSGPVAGGTERHTHEELKHQAILHTHEGIN